MATVHARPGESIESMLKRFQRAVARSGIISETRRRQYYVKASEQIRRKRERAARQRARLEKRSKQRQAR